MHQYRFLYPCQGRKPERVFAEGDARHAFPGSAAEQVRDCHTLKTVCCAVLYAI